MIGPKSPFAFSRAWIRQPRRTLTRLGRLKSNEDAQPSTPALFQPLTGTTCAPASSGSYSAGENGTTECRGGRRAPLLHQVVRRRESRAGRETLVRNTGCRRSDLESPFDW